MKRNSAFSLVEMLVVITVLALLVALLIPSMQKAKYLTRRSQCMSMMRQMGMAFFMYDGDNGELPWSKYNTPIGVTYGQYALREHYGLRGANVICPTMEDDTQTREQWAANWWDNEPQMTTANHRAFMGYVYWAGASTRNEESPANGIKYWGWGGEPDMAFAGLFPARSAVRPQGFPIDPPGNTRRPPRAASETPMVKDISYFSPNRDIPIVPHNFYPFYASHRDGNAQNAAGTNVMFLDGHVEWHNFVIGESWLIGSWTISQNTHTNNNSANFMMWTPKFSAPTNGSHPTGPQRLFLN